MSNSYFWFPTSPYRFAPLTLARSSAVNARFDEVSDGFDGVQAALDLKANLAGPTFTGTATFSAITATGAVTFSGAAAVTVPTIGSVADSTNKAATTAFVQAVLGAAGALLPVQTTHAGKFLQTNGTSASWGLLTVNNYSLSGNTSIDSTYSAAYIKATTSPTLTLAAPADLGAGWYCFIENAGTGDVTLSHTSGNIDGLTGYVMYPGEARMLRCDGSTVTTTVISAFRKLHTTSTTIAMPPGYRRLGFDMMGGGAGGGSGGRDATSASGGPGGPGGGRYLGRIEAPSVGTAITITIGLGGAGASARSTNGAPVMGTDGGTTEIVWSAVSRALASGGAVTNITMQRGGSGGAADNFAGQDASGWQGASISAYQTGESAEYGGATGASPTSSAASGLSGGSSLLGGPGGGSGGWGGGGYPGGDGGTRGRITIGGGGAKGAAAGGNGSTAANSGGGGGGGNTGAAAGSGANGTGYGAGGGGGGGVLGAFNSGAGGNGADGYLDIWGEP